MSDTMSKGRQATRLEIKEKKKRKKRIREIHLALSACG